MTPLIRYLDLRAYKYQLAEMYSLRTGIKPNAAIDTPYFGLSTDGLLTISRGYCWDGPSGPAIDTPSFMRGSLVHDALYQAIRMGLLHGDKRAEADKLLYRLAVEDGMSRLRAAWVYSAVRAMGWTACGPRECDRSVLKEAP